MRLPSLFGQEPRTLALVTTFVVAVVGGGALASASVGPASNANDSRVQDDPSGDGAATATATQTAVSTQTTTLTPTAEPMPTTTPTDAPTSTDTSAPTQTTAQPSQATATDTPTPTESSQPTPSTTATETVTPTQAAPGPETETPTSTQTDAPVARMCYPYPSVGEPDEPIEFSATGDDNVTYEWDFGTYQVGGSDVTASAGTATGQRVTNTFPEAGLYNVTLTVTTEDNRTDTRTRQVAVMYPRTRYCTPPDE